MTRLVNTGSKSANKDNVIHTDRSCMHVTESSLPVEDAPVDPEELRTCSWCNGTAPQEQNQTRECPFCGEVVDKLPMHLPCEEQP